MPITLTISELIDNGNFAPWIRLRSPNGTQLGSSFGTVTAQINVSAPVSGTYTVLVASGDGPGVGTGTYRITSSHSGIVSSAAGLRFVPVTPCRVADTRLPNGFGGPVISCEINTNF